MQQNINQKPKATFWTYAQPFAIGGFAGALSSAILYPIDLTKVRIQIRSEELGKAGHKGSVSPFVIAREVYHNYGARGFYKGLDSSIARQLLFSTTRLGVYKTMFDSMKKEADGTVSSIKKIYCAFVAGFLGTIIANPTDVAMVRLQADPTLPVADRRNYKNVFDALFRIVKEEGVATLWKGSFPTLVRGIVINLAILAPYDEIRERLNKYTGTHDTQSTKVIASAGAGFLASFWSLPFDNIKTKLQKMKADSQGVFPYNGITDCFLKSVRREGFWGLWVGFASYYFRTAPHVMITLLVQEYLTGFFNRRRQQL